MWSIFEYLFNPLSYNWRGDLFYCIAFNFVFQHILEYTIYISSKLRIENMTKKQCEPIQPSNNVLCCVFCYVVHLLYCNIACIFFILNTVSVSTRPIKHL